MSGLIVSKRKLHRTGDSIAVTLPPEWVKRWGLKAGQEVAVIGNGILQIVPPSHTTLLMDALMAQKEKPADAD